MPCSLAKSCCLNLSCVARSSSPILRFSSDNHFVQKRQMIAKELDRVTIVHRHVFADEMLVEDGRHRRDVLVGEAQVDAARTGVAGRRFEVAVDGTLA